MTFEILPIPAITPINSFPVALEPIRLDEVEYTLPAGWSFVFSGSSYASSYSSVVSAIENPSFAQDDGILFDSPGLPRSWVRLAAKDDDTDLLQNDFFAHEIVLVNGVPIVPGEWFEGSAGGEFRVFEGGVLDFRNLGTHVAPGATTGFEYSIGEGATLSTAKVTVSSGFAGDDDIRVPETDLAAFGQDWFRVGSVREGTTLLENDLGAEVVVTVNGQSIEEGVWFDGSAGGQFRVFAGGVVDFRNQGDLLELEVPTGFTYSTIKNGVIDTASVSLAGVPSGQAPIVIKGIDPRDDSGFSVASAGDVDGDGLGDVIIGAPGADRGSRTSTGESYLLFGSALADAEKELDLAALTAAQGVLIQGDFSSDESGFSVASAGDVDGDGLDDVIIGAPETDVAGVPKAGVSYLVFGSALTAAGGTFDLGSLSPTQGAVIRGIDVFDRSGASVSFAGDFDGDGLSDVIIGAPDVDTGFASSIGESYVVFGDALARGGQIDLETLSPAQGVVIKGISFGGQVGFSVSHAGDVNGDGLGDVLIGAPDTTLGQRSSVGESYLIFGDALTSAGGELELSALTAAQGVVIKGIYGNDESGTSVSSAGDVDGDGLDDVIIGAPGAEPDAVERAGESYLIFGDALAAANGLFDLASMSEGDGVVLKGIDTFDFSGESVSSAGDVDGDGLDDLIIGAHFANQNGERSVGESYVVFGAALATAGLEFDLATLTPSQGVIITGRDLYDFLGTSVSSAGDVDGDGLDDIIIGASGADPDGDSSAGESYLIYGSVLAAEKISDGLIDLDFLIV